LYTRSGWQESRPPSLADFSLQFGFGFEQSCRAVPLGHPRACHLRYARRAIASCDAPSAMGEGEVGVVARPLEDKDVPRLDAFMTVLLFRHLEPAAHESVQELFAPNFRHFMIF